MATRSAKTTTQTPAKKRVKIPGLAHQLRWFRDQSALIGDTPLEMCMKSGNPKLAVIVGENASGKSLLFRVLGARIRERTGATIVCSSIRERAQEGIARAFLYGDERTQSTGATTMSFIRGAIEKNLDREEGSVLALDEPELGLSDGYAHALGQFIGQSSQQLPEVCGGIVLVTHSRALVRGLLETCGKKPTFVMMGRDATDDINTWLETEEQRTIEDLLQLPDTGSQLFRELHKQIGI